MRHQTQHLYEQVASLRRSKHLTQRQIAARLDLAQSYIAKVERGQLDVGLGNFLDIVRLLDAELVIVPRDLVPVVTGMSAPNVVAKGAEKRARWAVSAEEIAEDDE